MNDMVKNKGLRIRAINPHGPIRVKESAARRNGNPSRCEMTREPKPFS